MVKLLKRYRLVSTKRYHFGSFTYTGVGDKISEMVSVSEKRLAASVFSSEMVPYHLVSVSKLFKEPAQEPGAKSSETVTVSEVLNAITI